MSDKFRIMFKNPDALFDNNLTDEQKEFALSWLTYGEILTVEFNPAGKTAVVLPKKMG